MAYPEIKEFMMINACLHSIRTSLFAAMVLCTSPAIARAAPVTFRFDAEITTVFPGIPYDSGLEFTVGDIISGKFTFEPNDGNGGVNLNVVQAFPAELEINGEILSTPSFEIQATNDSFLVGVSEVDSLIIGAGGLTVLNPNIVVDPNTSSFRITLFGPATVFDGAMIPDDVDRWNGLNFARTVFVGLRNGQGGAIGFQATLSQFAVIPEPSSLTILAFCFAAVMRPRFRRRKTFN